MEKPRKSVLITIMSLYGFIVLSGAELLAGNAIEPINNCRFSEHIWVRQSEKKTLWSGNDMIWKTLHHSISIPIAGKNWRL